MPELDAHEQRIMAYLDGAMPAAELEQFEAEMERDERLAAEVARLMGNDALLRKAFAGPIEHGVDAALLARMGLAEAPVGDTLAANDNQPFWRGWKLPLGTAIAASLALVATFALRDPASAPASPSVHFAEAMESLQSGQAAQLAAGSEVTPVLTFAAADGRYCREFRLEREARAGGGIACRTEGEWTVVALAGDAPELARMDAITLAEGASDSALDQAYETLGASDPFDADSEREVIARGWRDD